MQAKSLRWGVLGTARIADTRNFGPYTPIGPRSGPLGPNGQMDLPVAGTAGVPSGALAQAVVMNVTVTDGTQGSFLTVWPGDSTARPNVSDLNWVPGETVPNLVAVKLGAGQVHIYNLAGSTDVIADVAGYYA